MQERNKIKANNPYDKGGYSLLLCELIAYKIIYCKYDGEKE